MEESSKEGWIASRYAGPTKMLRKQEEEARKKARADLEQTSCVPSVIELNLKFCRNGTGGIRQGHFVHGQGRFPGSEQQGRRGSWLSSEFSNLESGEMSGFNG